MTPSSKWDMINNVLFVKIEGPIWYTIYYHLPVVKGVVSNPSINQPTNGKSTSMIRRVICPYFRIGFYSSIFFGVSSGNQSRLAGILTHSVRWFSHWKPHLYIGKFQSIAVIDYLRVYHHYISLPHYSKGINITYNTQIYPIKTPWNLITNEVTWL
jgi:hypothetical protein